MNKKAELSESLEDYLETILELEEEKKVARSKDIADKLGIQRGSVTGALKNLAKKKLIDYEPYGFVTLTDKGKKIAKEIALRHSVIKDFLFRILASGMLKIDENARSSMWEDLQAGRRSEVDYLNGAICRLGAKLKMPTPVNDKMMGCGE